MAETIHYPLLFKSHNFKNFFQCFGSMVPDATAANFKTVQHNIILRGQNLTDIFFLHEPFHVFCLWRRERVMCERPSTAVTFLKKRKIYHPAKSQQIGIVRM